MAIKPVLRMGDPRLFEPSKPIKKFRSDELNALIADMRDTMASLNGAGLAAPRRVGHMHRRPQRRGVDAHPECHNCALNFLHVFLYKVGI